jgi:hypothetical protein
VARPPSTNVAASPKRRRGVWIALGVVSGVALAGAVVALAVTLSSHDTGYNDWGTLVVTRR